MVKVLLNNLAVGSSERQALPPTLVSLANFDIENKEEEEQEEREEEMLLKSVDKKEVLKEGE